MKKFKRLPKFNEDFLVLWKKIHEDVMDFAGDM